MIVFRCEVNIGSDLAEVDFVDVFHLKMSFFGDEGKDLVRVKYSDSVIHWLLLADISDLLKFSGCNQNVYHGKYQLLEI
jgi:hypothetical protein